MPLPTARIVADQDTTLVARVDGPIDSPSPSISAVRHVARRFLKRVAFPPPPPYAYAADLTNLICIQFRLVMASLAILSRCLDNRVAIADWIGPLMA
jgi:hypothetical protein